MSEHELIVGIMEGLVMLPSIEEAIIALKPIIDTVMIYFNMYITSDEPPVIKRIYLTIINKYIAKKLPALAKNKTITAYLKFIQDFIDTNYLNPPLDFATS